MGFHNGIPITVVGGMQKMLTSLDSSRRRRDEDAAARKTS